MFEYLYQSRDNFNKKQFYIIIRETRLKSEYIKISNCLYNKQFVILFIKIIATKSPLHLTMQVNQH